MIDRRVIGRAARFSLIVVGVLANAPRNGRAQASTPPSPVVVGSLGLNDLECDCTFNPSAAKGRNFRFRSYPVILGVRSSGPSAGILYRGDTIVDIDGYSLRFEEGGRRFANVRPGVGVRLGVRRGRYVRVTVVPVAVSLARASQLGEYFPRVPRAHSSYDEEDEWNPPAAPATPGPVRAPRPPGQPATPAPGAASAIAARALAVAPPTPAPEIAAVAAAEAVPPVPPTVPASPASPRGWFGFSIRCNECGWSRNGNEEFPRWESVGYPEVTRVAPDGPAAAAGIRSGDLITHVDGISILTPEGGRRFGRLLPGQRLRLGLLRNGAAITRELRLAPRPGFASTGRPLRYTGKLRDVSIEVWSAAGPTVEQVGDTLIIMIGNSVVRLKGGRK